MSNTFSVSLLALCALLPLQLAAQTSGTTSPRARVIVKLRSDSELLPKVAAPGAVLRPMHAKALGQRLGMTLDDGAPVAERAQLIFADGTSSEALAERLSRETDVEYAVPDQRRHILTAPNDPLYASGVGGNGPTVGQWYLRAPSGAVASSIDIETAWAVTMGNPGIVVADIDTGVRYEHPDLLSVGSGGKLLPGYDMISDPNVANDGDGRDSDASDPGDWITSGESKHGVFAGCAAHDSVWHGTLVAGIIAALTNNGVGMAGIGPNLQLLPVRALGKCGGFDSDIIPAMLWAAGLPVPDAPMNLTPARVINMSLGASGACQAGYADAINAILATGAVIVVSAGNEAGHAISSPANCPGVIAVAGLRHAGTKVGFSNLGLDVAISAPAGNCVNTDPGTPCLYPILSTSNSGTTVPADSIYTDSFNFSVGTSFSAPQVSAAAALMLSVNPSLTPQQLKTILQATSSAFPTTGGDNGDGTPVPVCSVPQFDALGKPIDQLQCYCTIYTCGAGMLNAGAALAALVSKAAPVPVVEYYWAVADHYFMTSIPAEINALDNAPPGGWTRTGQVFGAWAQATGISGRVCRFYIPPAYGNSHYYSASADECAAAQVKFPALFEESPGVFFIDLPDLATGQCPAGTTPVYRLWNGRPDSNHRYTTSLSIRSDMIAKGYIPEGYGPLGVAMCAPPLAVGAAAQ